ncbi:MAG: Lrp/AsnC family transcriptional regulator [Gammaproteobacteria bacterium]|nr:Lrp/AsnC family transcriptional regulator [Gammaproteobacteria bacterium]
MSLPQLDELDRRILELLAGDARVSNRQLAGQLGVTEGTVRGRLKRLEADKLIRFSAITNVSLLGSRKVVLIGVQAQLSELPALCQKLAAMREIRCVIAMLGRYNILCVALLDSLQEISDLASNRILALPGVQQVDTSIAVHTLKYDPRFSRVMKRPG